MKKYTIYTLLFVLFFTGLGKAQLTVHKMVSIGYVYQNQSFAEVGGKLLFLNTDDVIYRLGVSGLMGSTQGKFIILPKLQGDVLFNFERNVDLYHSYYFLAGAELTNKYVAPKVGLSLFGLLDLTAGYAFSINESGIDGKILKGININLGVNIPIVLIYDLLH